MHHIGTQVGSVAERKRAEAALRETEARAGKAHAVLDDANESITVGFALFGPDDRLQLCNNRYRDLLCPGTQQMVTQSKTFEAIMRSARDGGVVAIYADIAEPKLREVELAEDAPAAVLLDFMMPEMDGLEFLARLSNKKASQSIPVELLVEKGGDEIGTILASLEKILPAPARAGK